MTKAQIEIDSDMLAGLVRDELMWFYENGEDLSKKDRKALKRAVLFFLTPDEILETFGEKTYRKFFNVS